MNAVTVPGGGTGLQAASNGGSIRPFRPDTPTSEGDRLSDGEQDSAPAMEAVLGVLEQMYAEEPPAAPGQADRSSRRGRMHAAAAVCSQASAEKRRPAMREHGCGGADEGIANAMHAPVGGDGERENTSVRAGVSGTPAAAPRHVPSRPGPQARAGGTPRCDPMCGKAAAAVRVKHVRSIMGPSDWTRTDGPVDALGHASVAVHHAAAKAASARTQQDWDLGRGQPPAARPARAHAPSAQKRGKKTRKSTKRKTKLGAAAAAAATQRGPRAARRAASVVQEAAAVSASLRRGVGGADVCSRLAASPARVTRTRACSGPRPPPRSHVDRTHLQGAPGKPAPHQAAAAIAASAVPNVSPLAGQDHGSRKTNPGRGSGKRRSVGSARVVTQPRGPGTAVRHFGAQADCSADSDGAGGEPAAPAAHGGADRGFFSMHDVCTWERRREMAQEARSGTAASGRSTASEWAPDGASDVGHSPMSSGEDGDDPWSTVGGEDCGHAMWPKGVSVGGGPSTGEGEEMQTLGGGGRGEHPGGGAERPHAPASVAASSAGQSEEQAHAWTPWGAAVRQRMHPAALSRQSSSTAAQPRGVVVGTPRRTRGSRSDVGAAREAAMAQRAALCEAGCTPHEQPGCGRREEEGYPEREHDSGGGHDADGQGAPLSMKNSDRFADAEESDESAGGAAGQL